jgi:hypothetical protein
MNKSKMKEIRRQVRSADLDNASQMNNQEKDLQVEAYNEACMEEKYSNGRREVLNELWTTDKILKDGYWFVKLTDVIKIIDNYRN